MNIIELPVGEETLRLNWDRAKFSAIIPVSKDTSTLYYDGMKLDLSIGASTFNKFMDNLESEDNLKEQLESLMSSYTFKGEFFNSLNNPQSSHLQHTKWETDIVKVSEKDGEVKIQCKTLVHSSFLVNEGGTQVTKTTSYHKNHQIGKCRNHQSMRDFILKSLSDDLDKHTHLFRNHTLHWPARRDYGKFRYFEQGGVEVPVYLDPKVYENSIIEGAAIQVEVTRFGSIEQGRISTTSAEIAGRARLQAARIIALGPVICKKVLDAEYLSSYKGMFPMHAESSRRKGLTCGKVASHMLSGDY